MGGAGRRKKKIMMMAVVVVAVGQAIKERHFLCQVRGGFRLMLLRLFSFCSRV